MVFALHDLSTEQAASGGVARGEVCDLTTHQFGELVYRGIGLQGTPIRGIGLQGNWFTGELVYWGIGLQGIWFTDLAHLRELRGLGTIGIAGRRDRVVA